MQPKKATIYFFVAYLGFLINLGPSLHHAEIFGFHSHQAGSSSCCHSHSAHSHSAHAHTAHSHCCHGHAAEHPADELIVQQGTDGHDCAFCKFFKQYHVIVETVDSLDVAGFTLLRPFERPSDVCSESFIPVARGPPATV